MDLNCKDCKNKIEPFNINVTTDLAKCGICGSIQRASELLLDLEIEEELKTLKGSEILISQGVNDKFEFSYPKKGFSVYQIPKLLFVLFWFAFIAFWTWGASQGSIFFALFSIPFWLAGFSMLIGIINDTNEIQIISIDRFRLEIKKIRPIFSKTYETNLEDIQSVKMQKVDMNKVSIFKDFNLGSKMQYGFGMEFPAIITGGETEYFFEDANDAEQEWIIKMVGSLMQKTRQ